MTIYVITRHLGALDWVKSKGIYFDIHLEHLMSLNDLQSGDIVIGTLPINIVSKINEMGVRYIHLSLEIPIHLRGMELTMEQFENCNVTLEEYSVTKCCKLF